MHTTSLVYLTTFFVLCVPLSYFIFSIFKFQMKPQILKQAWGLILKPTILFSHRNGNQ